MSHITWPFCQLESLFFCPKLESCHEIQLKWQRRKRGVGIGLVFSFLWYEYLEYAITRIVFLKFGEHGGECIGHNVNQCFLLQILTSGKCIYSKFISNWNQNQNSIFNVNFNLVWWTLRVNCAQYRSMLYVTHLNCRKMHLFKIYLKLRLKQKFEFQFSLVNTQTALFVTNFYYRSMHLF